MNNPFLLNSILPCRWELRQPAARQRRAVKTVRQKVEGWENAVRIVIAVAKKETFKNEQIMNRFFKKSILSVCLLAGIPFVGAGAQHPAPPDTVAIRPSSRTAGPEYEYDRNGNLTKDLNRNISKIEYNCLNLPQNIVFMNGNSILHEYMANGELVKTTYKVSGKADRVVEYNGNAIYENGELKMLLNEAGYVSMPDKKFHFYIKDHQGNIRAVADAEGNVEEVNDYYPLGGLMSGTASNGFQPYKYNGKELERANGLDEYNYGARRYDPMLGRWHAPDPMAEQYSGVSPYVYCLNNPLKYVDPIGKTVHIYYRNAQGQKVYYPYSGGTVRNSNPFVRAVVAAYNFNKANGISAGNGGGGSTVEMVEKSEIIDIMQTNGESKYAPDATRGTLYWNPALGAKYANGTVVSPATILDHEAAHALEHKRRPAKYEAARSTPDSRYSNEEERRVITGPEQKTAAANGEISRGGVTRTNHGGTSVVTKGVTSNQIVKEYEEKTWSSEVVE